MSDAESMFDIEQEYVKNEKLKREDVKALECWIEKNLQNVKFAELDLFKFLHSCYYDFDLAKATAESYHNLRSQWPEVFKNRNPTKTPINEQLCVSCFKMLNKSTYDDYKIMFVKLTDCDPNKYNFELQLKTCFSVVDFDLITLANSAGFVVLFDLEGITWGHIPKFGIGALRKFINYVQDALPVRLKEVHLLNVNPIIEKLYFLAKMFMKKELIEIVHLHSNVELSHKFVPKNLFPKDYGGDDLTVKELHDSMIKILVENAEFFAKDDEEIKEVQDKFRYIEID